VPIGEGEDGVTQEDRIGGVEALGRGEVGVEAGRGFVLTERPGVQGHVPVEHVQPPEPTPQGTVGFSEQTDGEGAVLTHPATARRFPLSTDGAGVP